jgi:hypothetical protein
VEDGVAVRLSNVALNLAGVHDESAVRVKVWLDFVNENNVRKSSLLIATLRTHRCENNGPMMVRMDCDVDVSQWNMIEVHVSGSVFYQTNSEFDDKSMWTFSERDGSHKRQKTARND